MKAHGLRRSANGHAQNGSSAGILSAHCWTSYWPIIWKKSGIQKKVFSGVLRNDTSKKRNIFSRQWRYNTTPVKMTTYNIIKWQHITIKWPHIVIK
jgi:hypothetical protein